MNKSTLKLTSPKQIDGALYETLACEYLQLQGLKLVAANWLKPKVGEIDLIMMESGKFWDTIVFIEVRSRKGDKYGDALASVTKAKQKKLIKAARFFLQENPQFEQHECRFDVLAFSQKLMTDTRCSNHKPTLKHIFAKEQVVNPKIQEGTPEWVQGAFVASAWA